jgi:flagellar assembly factor FliW
MSAPSTVEAITGRVLTFVEPPPGLLTLTEFVLNEVEGAAQLFTLRSLQAPQTRLFLIDPQPYFPDYTPVVDEEVLASLAPDGSAVSVLAVVHPGEGGEAPTANLLAPVLVNHVLGTAAQVVLDEDWPLRASLVAPEQG